MRNILQIHGIGKRNNYNLINSKTYCQVFGSYGRQVLCMMQQS
jgi:hypothetical protein